MQLLSKRKMVAICFYMLPFEEKKEKKERKKQKANNKKNPLCHCLFLLFYYKLTKVLYNPVLYKLVS